VNRASKKLAPAGFTTGRRVRAIFKHESRLTIHHSRLSRFLMKQFLPLSFALLVCGQAAAPARQTPAQTPRRPPAAETQGARPAPPQPAPRPVGRQPLDLADLGIQIAPDPRLFVVMAALDAAGWDPTPRGAEPSAFRAQLRRDTAALDPVLRERLRSFYTRYLLKGEGVTAAEQAARYVSLAYTLGPAPGFEAPPRSDDLPAGLLDVLDFAPLVREFYRQTALDEKLPNYLNMHRAAGDALRRPAQEMAREVLAYLNTRPETVFYEQVESPASPPKGQKKDEKKTFVTRERERRFVIVPDLLGAPGAVNFRVVGDDYFAIVPAGTDARASEMRRAYIQYVVDPLVARHAKEVAARRVEIKQLLDAERTRGGRDLSPDVFLSVSRSLVAAANARMDASTRLRALQLETSRRLQAAGADQAAREAALKESKEGQAAVEEETTAQLAEDYERGAVLAFYFAEQLRGLEGSGFDVNNFVAPMVADFKVERELRRPGEYAAAVTRVAEARKRAREARAAAAATLAGPQDARRAALIKSLSDVDDLLRLKNYEAAEERLLQLRAEHREEPRVYFGLGQASLLAAGAAFDDALQEQRLSAALQHFRQVVLFASPETDRALLSRTHAASARVLAFLDRKEEALREIEAALALGDVAGGAYKEALAEKKKLTGQ
jgi:hypothetical protein